MAKLDVLFTIYVVVKQGHLLKILSLNLIMFQNTIVPMVLENHVVPTYMISVIQSLVIIKAYLYIVASKRSTCIILKVM